MGPRLIVVEGTARKPYYELPEGEGTVIGRSRTADIRIRAKAVSRMHCSIVNEGGICRVFDMCSQNGTYLNKKPIDSSELRDGDILYVGTAQLQFKDENRMPVIVNEGPPVRRHRSRRSRRRHRSEGNENVSGPDRPRTHMSKEKGAPLQVKLPDRELSDGGARSRRGAQAARRQGKRTRRAADSPSPRGVRPKRSTSSPKASGPAGGLAPGKVSQAWQYPSADELICRQCQKRVPHEVARGRNVKKCPRCGGEVVTMNTHREDVLSQLDRIR